MCAHSAHSRNVDAIDVQRREELTVIFEKEWPEDDENANEFWLRINGVANSECKEGFVCFCVVFVYLAHMLFVVFVECHRC